MKLTKYLQDKYIQITIFIIGYFLLLMFLISFKANIILIIIISSIFIFFSIITAIISFIKKKKFYDNLLLNIERLDKKYLVIETINKPNTYEEEILHDALYEINKSMLEQIKNYETNSNNFKEYIEMWIHEVKIPIASLVLMCHNKKSDKNLLEQIRRLDNYIDQVLYYVRSENTEEDYIIKEVSLNKIISKVALKNKDDLLNNNINFIVSIHEETILTDSKWLEFIINQIINNSIKYKKEDHSYIKIETKKEKNKIILNITDNGIGIRKNDLKKVFNKTFTGENGRNSSKSTGMGLYIAKQLCEKLNHKIEINSEVNKYTTVSISFLKNNYYKF